MTKLLRVDLGSGGTSDEEIDPAFLRARLGGKGLATAILAREVGPDVDPLSPQSKFVLSIGPLAGTMMPGGNRFAAHFISPQTNGYGESYAGGNVAAQFARTGYCAVVLEGRAPAPVFVDVTPDGAKLRDARDLWGEDTFTAETAIVERTGDPKAQACVIGPAGERLVRFACVENNRWHSLGRGGPGAVLGSKNVKGLAFRGGRRVEPERPEAFRRLAKDLGVRAKDAPGALALRRNGTAGLVRVANMEGLFPTRYWQQGRLEGWESLTAETLREECEVHSGACPPCVLRCVKHVVVKGGPYAGLELEGPEYETLYAFGGLCEIRDLVDVIRLNDVCDRHGIDTITVGNLCALAIEAGRRGLLETRVEYGDADGILELIELIVRREGIGDLLAEGILAVENELGLEGMAVHVKGMEPAGYDPRVCKGMGLGYETSARGACHLRGTMFRAELSGLIEPGATDGKAAFYVDWENRFAIHDSLIYCRFYRDYTEWPYLTEVVNAAVGTEYSVDDLQRLGADIITETQEINRRRGFGHDHERLPEWITAHPLPEDPAHRISREELDGMRREYYALRGWAWDTG